MKRIAFINGIGGTMLVDEARKEEYIKAGYKPADVPASENVTNTEEPVKKARKKKEV